MSSTRANYGRNDVYRCAIRQRFVGEEREPSSTLEL